NASYSIHSIQAAVCRNAPFAFCRCLPPSAPASSTISRALPRLPILPADPPVQPSTTCCLFNCFLGLLRISLRLCSERFPFHFLTLNPQLAPPRMLNCLFSILVLPRRAHTMKRTPGKLKGLK